MNPLPTTPRALYQRIATGSPKAMAALDALLVHPDVTWETPLHSGVYTVLDAICRHPDATSRRELLSRFEKSHPEGHPVWAEQVHCALYADWETVQRFHRCGADLAVRDSDGRSLATHAVLRNDSADGVACFHALRRIEPTCATAEVLEASWVAALNGCHPVFTSEFLKMGCSPNRQIWNPRVQSYSGSLPTALVVNHWRSFGGLDGTPKIKAVMKALDDRGADWGLATFGKSAAKDMMDWGLWNTFQRWQAEWAHERAQVLDAKLPPATPRPLGSSHRL